MKISNIVDLKKKIKFFETIIFDLDDTIYSQKHYDTPALKLVSRYLSKVVDINSKKIFSEIRKLKKLKRGKHPLLVFNRYLKNFKISSKEKRKFINKSVNLFQSFSCKNLNKVPSLKTLIKNLSKEKDLFLVTNGHVFRQKRKIKYLGINNYFNKIFILDGVRKKIKPSIKNVNYLVNFLKKKHKKKAVYVGDNKKSDKLFAENLKIDFIHFEFPD